jgi:hypothetical protein
MFCDTVLLRRRVLASSLLDVQHIDPQIFTYRISFPSALTASTGVSLRSSDTIHVLDIRSDYVVNWQLVRNLGGSISHAKTHGSLSPPGYICKIDATPLLEFPCECTISDRQQLRCLGVLGRLRTAHLHYHSSLEETVQSKQKARSFAINEHTSGVPGAT